MSDDDIDMDRVVSDPQYRRGVIEFLNSSSLLSRDLEDNPNFGRHLEAGLQAAGRE